MTKTKIGWASSFTTATNIAKDAMNGIEYTLESKRSALNRKHLTPGELLNELRNSDSEAERQLADQLDFIIEDRIGQGREELADIEAAMQDAMKVLDEAVSSLQDVLGKMDNPD